jgi:hypothetical protein
MRTSREHTYSSTVRQDIYGSTFKQDSRTPDYSRVRRMWQPSGPITQLRRIKPVCI